MLPSRRIANMFGAIAYSVLLTSYAMVAGIVLIWLLNGGVISSTQVAQNSSPADDALIAESSGSIAAIIVEIFAYIITAFVALTVLFVAITLPYWLGKSGSYLLKRGIWLCQWSVTALTLLIGKIIAVGLAGVPLMLIVMQDISTITVLISVSIMLGASLVLFLLQHYLAKMTGLEAEEIW